MYASTKAINLAIRLALRLGKIRPEDEARHRAILATHTPAAVSDLIKSYNAETGWTSAAPASDRQRAYLASLEKRVFGVVQTMPGRPLSSKDADERIRYFKEVAAQIDAQVASVTDVDFSLDSLLSEKGEV